MSNIKNAPTGLSQLNNSELNEVNGGRQKPVLRFPFGGHVIWEPLVWRK
jgi:bacteriocin-like protein